MKYDVCIIGGGAAGLCAASALDHELNICIIEKNENPGRKILATGGGRCNLTNRACEGCDDTLGFFASLGLCTYEDEEGRYYPYSGRAADVVEAFLRSLSENVKLSCRTSVEQIEKTPDGFLIKSQKKSFYSRTVLLATGGKAAPQFGTVGDGYKLAGKFGHRSSRVYPILTGIECQDPQGDGKLFPKLKGIRARGRVTLKKNGLAVKKPDGSPAVETGEIQFTEYGLSGICIFNLTPYIKAEDGENFREALKKFSLSIDLAPDFDEAVLKGRVTTFGILTEKLSEHITMDMLKDWEVSITGIRGWRDAQCTAGGILLEDIDPGSMESRLVEGLYFAGEILDIQGPCGGYNLQNAWETGIRAAKAINTALSKE